MYIYKNLIQRNNKPSFDQHSFVHPSALLPIVPTIKTDTLKAKRGINCPFCTLF